MFYLYNEKSEYIAVATLNKKNKELQINQAQAPTTSGIATLKKSNNSTNEWLLTVSKAKAIDHRLLKILSAIVIDKRFKCNGQEAKEITK